MKVLMVTPSYYPIFGGTETYVRQLTQKLNQKGVDADVLTLNMNSKWSPVNKEEILRDNGFRVFRVSAYNPRVFNLHNHSLYGELFNVHVIPRLSFAKEFDNYDIIHFQDDTDFTFPFFSYIRHGKNKPTLLHFHTIPYTYIRYKKNLLLRMMLKRVADSYIGVSTWTVGFMLDLGLPRDRLVTLPNAVDIETFRPDEKRRTDNTVLWVGRIIPEKGLEVLLKAIFHLRTQTQVTIIGPVDPFYKSFFSEIQCLMKKINGETEHNVSYLGPMRGKALIEWYQRAAIFATPAHTEHFGITNLEALACGTPVIATKVGGVPDVVKDGLNGLLVPPNEPLALALALENLLENKKLRESYGRNGRAIVKKCFSWDKILEKIVRIYNKLLEMEK